MRLEIDYDRVAMRQSVSLILHTLHDYIPRAAFRDAENALCEMFATDGVELTSRHMRKEYQAWKAIQISPLYTPPDKTVDDQVNGLFKNTKAASE